jgi:hypothetical protein
MARTFFCVSLLQLMRLSFVVEGVVTVIFFKFSFASPVWVRRFWGLTIALCLGSLALTRCKQGSTSSEVEHYFTDDQQLWALGQVDLSDAPQVPDIYLKLNEKSVSPGVPAAALVQGLDTYQLIGQLGGDEKGVAVVDYHPSEEKLLSYIYKIAVLESGPGKWSVYASLLKTPKAAKRAMVVIGTVVARPTDKPLKIALAKGLQRSVIVDGPMLGFWALHVPDVRKTVVKPWLGVCPRSPDVGQQVLQNAQIPSQLPGQNVGQNPLQGPGQIDGCRTLARELDLCNGSPLTSGACMPNFDAMVKELAADSINDPSLKTSFEALEFKIEPMRGLTRSAGQEYGFSLEKGSEYGQFQVSFPKYPVATEVENTNLCTTGFISVQQTLGGLDNPACEVRLVPISLGQSTPSASSLRCGFQVQFKNPSTYLEKICQMTFEARLPLRGGQSGSVAAPAPAPILRQWFRLQVVTQL